MKKKVFLMSIAMLMTFNASANPGSNDDNPPVEDGKEHKAPARRLQVSLDNGMVTIWYPYIINNVEIIIRDVTGCIIYQETLDELDYTYVIYLTDEEASFAESIELVYGDQYIIRNIGQ